MTIIELAFRQEVNRRFQEPLQGRISDSVFPPQITLPAAVYARIGITSRARTYGQGADRLRARIQLTLRDTEYTAVKRLQRRVEDAFAPFCGWMGMEGDCCPVWVESVEVVTMPDVVEPKTRHRLAISDYIFTYLKNGVT